MFIEETGVPLPFAPGDLILALGGIAVAGGRVNPVLLVAAVAVSITVGALIGRGAAALLGWERLMRIAEPLRARGPLERAAGMLQRGGWRAVFTARPLPCPRRFTTPGARGSPGALKAIFWGVGPAGRGYNRRLLRPCGPPRPPL